MRALTIRPTRVSVVDMNDIRPPQKTGAKSKIKKGVETIGFVGALTLREIGDGTYEIVDGRRRWSELFAMGADSVNAVIVDKHTTDAEAAAIALVKNIQRSENPLDEARNIQSLRKHGFDDKFISAQLGLPPATIKKRVKLLGLPKSIQKGVCDGNIAVSTAESLANMSEEQQEKAEQVYLGYGELKGSDLSAIRSERVQQAVSSPPAVAPQGQSKQDVELLFRQASAAAHAAGITQKRMMEIIKETKPAKKAS